MKTARGLIAFTMAFLLILPWFIHNTESKAAAEEPAEALPFAEEWELRFTKEPEQLDLIPCGAAVYKDTVVNSLTGTLGTPEVTVSEVDEEGNVTYTVTFVVDVDMDYSYPLQYDNALTVNFNSYLPYDYYTGTFFDFERLHTDGNETESENDKQGEFDCGGETIVYSGEHVLSAEWGEPKVTDLNGERNVVWHLTAAETYTIVVPADYDGLIFGSEYARQALSPEITMAEDYQKPAVWEGDPADWIFFKAAELAEPQSDA